MKQRIILSLAALCLTLAAQAAGNYEVSVLLPDSTHEGQTMYLTSYDTGDTIATGIIRGNECSIKGTTDNSWFARLLFDGHRMGFMVEPGLIKIDWLNFLAVGTPLNSQLNALGTAFEKVKSEDEEMLIFYRAYEANKDNGIGPWAYYNYLMCKDYNLQQLDSALATVPAYYKSQQRFKNAVANAKAQQVTGQGQKFTDFAIPDANGKLQRLSDYVGRGNYTLVDFWASWCGPCRREIPNIKALYEKYNGKGMNFVGVAVWDAPADSRKAISQLQIPWPCIVGTHNLTEPTKLYGIMGIPHIIIFDPKGRIVARGLSGKELAAKVDELMAK